MENFVKPTSIPASAGLNATTLLATPSSCVKVEGRKTGAVVRVPAVVGKTIVQIYVEAVADLEEPALEITNIKHDLNLTGCEFMQVEDAQNGKLIISGYIRENIDYTSAKAAEDGIVSVGNRRKGMNIPFKCFTKIKLDSEPEVSTSNSLFVPEETRIPNAVTASNSFYSSTNEELSFEVAETKIRQVNVKRNTADIAINNYREEAFSSLSINMAVDVVLVILQNQFVEIPSSGKSSSSNQSSSDKSGNSNESSKKSNDSGNGNQKGNQRSRSKWGKFGWMKMFNF